MSRIKPNPKEDPDLPASIRLQLEYKVLNPEEIHYLYIEHAKFCMTRFMHDHLERPHGSNNSIAVVVRANSFIGIDQVYVRCFCADDVNNKKTGNRSPADFVDRNGIKELMEYKTIPKKLLETKFGADALVDGVVRRRIEKLYETHQVCLPYNTLNL